MAQVEFHDGKESYGTADMIVIPRKGEVVKYGSEKNHKTFKVVRIEWIVRPGDAPGARVVLRRLRKHGE